MVQCVYTEDRFVIMTTSPTFSVHEKQPIISDDCTLYIFPYAPSPIKSEVSQQVSGSSLRIYDGRIFFSLTADVLLENKPRSFSSNAAISFCYNQQQDYNGS